MKKFEYRSPRFSVDLPVEFTVKALVYRGRCTEISSEGMTVELREQPAAEAAGTVSMAFHGQPMEFAARVAHVEAMHVGLILSRGSEAERRAINRMIASLSSSQRRTGPVLLS